MKLVDVLKMRESHLHDNDSFSPPRQLPNSQIIEKGSHPDTFTTGNITAGHNRVNAAGRHAFCELRTLCAAMSMPEFSTRCNTVMRWLPHAACTPSSDMLSAVTNELRAAQGLHSSPLTTMLKSVAAGNLVRMPLIPKPSRMKYSKFSFCPSSFS